MVVMVFNSTFNNISVIVAVSFIGRGSREYPEKATELSKVTDKLDHISSTPPMSAINVTCKYDAIVNGNGVNGLHVWCNSEIGNVERFNQCRYRPKLFIKIRLCQFLMKALLK